MLRETPSLPEWCRRAVLTLLEVSPGDGWGEAGRVGHDRSSTNSVYMIERFDGCAAPGATIGITY